MHQSIYQGTDIPGISACFIQHLLRLTPQAHRSIQAYDQMTEVRRCFHPIADFLEMRQVKTMQRLATLHIARTKGCVIGGDASAYLDVEASPVGKRYARRLYIGRSMYEHRQQVGPKLLCQVKSTLVEALDIAVW